MKLHHIGQAVADMDAALDEYASSGIAFDAGPRFDVRTQKVRVCFLAFAGGTCIELVEPTGQSGPLDALLKRGGGFYHVAYAVADVVAKCDDLESRGYRTLDTFASEAFGGGTCAFLLSPSGALIELVPDNAAA